MALMSKICGYERLDTSALDLEAVSAAVLAGLRGCRGGGGGAVR